MTTHSNDPTQRPGALDLASLETVPAVFDMAPQAHAAPAAHPAPTPEPGFQVELAILSRQGGRRYNEDACGHWHSDDHLCCVVADGAGGHGGGDIASKLAVQSLIGGYAAQPAGTPAEVEALIRATNASILAHRGEGATQHMHTTVVALLIDLAHRRALWGHAGDSRLYVLRGGRVAAQTRDHSLVQSLVDGGLLAPEKMRTHPQRSELLSALGTQEHELMVSAVAEPWAILPGDVFLLCTDGLWEYVEESLLESSLAQAADPQAWLAQLEERVLQNAAHKPNHDNFSALTVWIVPDLRLAP